MIHNIINQLIHFYEHADAATLADGSTRLGRMDVAQMPAWPRDETEVYLCGPSGFMQAQWQALLAAGVPALRLHREVFGPDLLDNIA